MSSRGDDLFAAEGEERGINVFSEHSLHDTLKRIAAGSGGRIEVSVAGKIADAVRPDGEIVEIQTARLSAVQEKAKAWAEAGRRVRVQYPVVANCTILRIDSRTGELLSRRTSPRHREFWCAFDELVRAPSLIGTPGIVFEVLMVEITERREVLAEPVRRGRFMRSFAVVDRSLDRIVSNREFACAGDWLALLAAGRGEEASWSSESLGQALGVSATTARKVLYSLARAGLLRQAGSDGRKKLYRRIDPISAKAAETGSGSS